jgi:hypothetical protein
VKCAKLLLSHIYVVTTSVQDHICIWIVDTRSWEKTRRNISISDKKLVSRIKYPIFLVGRARIELTTNGLKVRCST